MGSDLLGPPWVRLPANIGGRIERIDGLLMQALAAESEGKAATPMAQNIYPATPLTPDLMVGDIFIPKERRGR